MKIGIITFHWATNYGAVIQTYALQKYFDLNGYETEIINYIPFKTKVSQIITNIQKLNFNELAKEVRINQFRKRYLTLSNKKYYSNKSLKNHCDKYDIYVCGSDQIWNESFILYAEKDPTLSYYLNFVSSDKTRIAYAVSFGTNKLSPEIIELVRPELKKFKYVSVRENTGKKIIDDMRIKATLVVDPTLLLEREEYEKLIENKKTKEKYQLFSYFLHENQIEAEKTAIYIYGKYFKEGIDKKYNNEPVGLFEWLCGIKNSRLVLTNSFHGTIFAIIFNKPFIVVPVEGSSMNDRIITLLNFVGLDNRILNNFDKIDIDSLMIEPIDWEKVDSKLKQLRKSSIEFLENSLM